MARAARVLDELLRFDAVEDWPAPEEQTVWYGAAETERALLDAYRSGRMHHAWLFGGPKGIGKATLTYRFARFVLANPDPARAGEADDLSVPEDSPTFRKVAGRAHPNLLILERPWDEQGKRFRTRLTVEEVRKTVPFFGSTGGEANWRIAIVDAADDMNANAANALLKILEEPPARSLFLLISHAPGRLLPTIRSRSRKLDIAPLPAGTIATALRDHGEDGDDLDLAANLAEGSLRRAILLLAGGGVDTYRKLTRLLSHLPQVDMDALHAFADSVTGRGDDDAWRGFDDMLSAWLNRRVRGENEPETGISLAPAAAAAPLERWPEVWDNLRRSVDETDALNLDRKRAVLSVLMSLVRASRM
jgi:DNA polymerase-3 subunit delta'